MDRFADVDGGGSFAIASSQVSTLQREQIIYQSFNLIYIIDIYMFLLPEAACGNFASLLFTIHKPSVLRMNKNYKFLKIHTIIKNNKLMHVLCIKIYLSQIDRHELSG